MAEPIVIQNPTTQKIKIKPEATKPIDIPTVEGATKKDQLIDYLKRYGKDEFTDLSKILMFLYGQQFESCKTALRSLMNEHKAEIRGDLYKLGATWGQRIIKYGEEKDIIVEGNFTNVPIQGRFLEEI